MRAVIDEYTCKSLVGTIFESQELQVEGEETMKVSLARTATACRKVRGRYGPTRSRVRGRGPRAQLTLFRHALDNEIARFRRALAAFGQDPHLLARKFFLSLPHPLLGDAMADASPIRINGERTHTWKAAPLLGEHNRYVFLDLLGLTEEELSAYIAQGVIG